MSSASLTTATITRAAAAALIEAARRAAEDHGFRAAIAVTDSGGHLMAFSRVDGASFLAGEVAVGKAWTAASYGTATHTWNAYVGDSHVAPLAHHPRVTAVGGGYPIFDDGHLIGGIGVSGGTYEQDQSVAEAALRAVDLAVTDPYVHTPGAEAM